MKCKTYIFHQCLHKCTFLCWLYICMINIICNLKKKKKEEDQKKKVRKNQFWSVWRNQQYGLWSHQSYRNCIGHLHHIDVGLCIVCLSSTSKDRTQCDMEWLIMSLICNPHYFILRVFFFFGAYFTINRLFSYWFWWIIIWWNR